jgi:hypothetical protein
LRQTVDRLGDVLDVARTVAVGASGVVHAFLEHALGSVARLAAVLADE